MRVHHHRIAGAQAACDAYGGTPSDDLAETLAGKPIYFEKPLGLTMNCTQASLDVPARHPVPFMRGCNRRFDPDNASQRVAEENGKLTFSDELEPRTHPAAHRP